MVYEQRDYCMFKTGTRCSEKCVGFNKDKRYPTQCMLLNCLMTLSKNKKQKGIENDI